MTPQFGCALMPRMNAQRHAGAQLEAVHKALHTYVVRWHDEDSGWKSLTVLAKSSQSAEQTVYEALGYSHYVRAFPCQ